MISLKFGLLFLAFLSLLWVPGKADDSIKTDTVELVIQGKRLVIYLDELAELEEFNRQSIDSIIRRLNEVIQELNRSEVFSGDTSIIIKEVGKQPMHIELNSHSSGDALDLNFRSIHVSVQENHNGTDRVHVTIIKDTSKQEDYNELELDFSFGWNNYLGPGGFPSGEDHELNPAQSRFARFGMIFTLPFDKKKKSPAVRTGLEISYYNFMFDQKNRFEDLGSTTNFYEDTVNRVRKSKLRATYLSVPIMLAFEVNNGKTQRGIHFSVGADAAYRIGSKSITKFKGGKKEKDRGSYNLEPMQYTLRAELGYRFLTLTAGYTINPMFVDGAGPDVNKIYFGFRI